MNTNKPRAIAVQNKIESQTSEGLGTSKVSREITSLQNYIKNSEIIYMTASKVLNLIEEEQPTNEIKGKFKFTIYNSDNQQIVNEPVKYQNGCYLIINLKTGNYKITIDSTCYHQVKDQEIEIKQPPDITTSLITQIKLKKREPDCKEIVGWVERSETHQRRNHINV